MRTIGEVEEEQPLSTGLRGSSCVNATLEDIIPSASWAKGSVAAGAAVKGVEEGVNQEKVSK